MNSNLFEECVISIEVITLTVIIIYTMPNKYMTTFLVGLRVVTNETLFESSQGMENSISIMP
jgi:hypothetical protein